VDDASYEKVILPDNVLFLLDWCPR